MSFCLSLAMPLFILLYFYGEDTAFRWLITALNSTFYPQSVIRVYVLANIPFPGFATFYAPLRSAERKSMSNENAWMKSGNINVISEDYRKKGHKEIPKSTTNHKYLDTPRFVIA